ncbi:MAG: STAS/SEC14 domain-containing protein [Bacteroidales bacterium]|nr:STAS/SEC14 domain-containing protein [Bacteroidales bacterium]
MIEISYNNQEDIIYVRRVGEISSEDIFKYINEIDKQFENHKTLYVLSDTRGSQTLFHQNDLVLFVAEIKKRIGPYKKVREASIVDNPYDTALGMMYEYIASEIDKFKCKAFSTEEAAKSWLKSGS